MRVNSPTGFIALTGKAPSLQLANIVLPSKEERAAIDALDRKLDAIARSLKTD